MGNILAEDGLAKLIALIKKDMALANHKHSLDSLSNVNVLNKKDGQSLVWDEVRSAWVAKTIDIDLTEIEGELNTLSDKLATAQKELATKIGRSEFDVNNDKLNKKIKSIENVLSEHEGEIGTKVTQQDVNNTLKVFRSEFLDALDYIQSNTIDIETLEYLNNKMDNYDVNIKDIMDSLEVVVTKDEMNKNLSNTVYGNLLNDSGFELDNGSWVKEGAVIDTSVAHGGTNSIKLEGADTSLFVMQKLGNKLFPNRTYTLSGQYKKDNIVFSDNPTLQIRVRFYNGERFISEESTNFGEGTCDWTKFVMTFSVPENTDTSFVHILGENFTGTLHVDSLQLETGSQSTSWSISNEDNTYITDNLFNRLTNAETVILENKASLSMKVNKEDYNVAIGDLTNEINMNADNIEAISVEMSQKVAKSEYDETIGGIQTSIIDVDSKVTQTANELSTKVSQVEYDASMGVIGDKLSEAESQIIQQADLIASKVSKTEYDTDKTDLENRVTTTESVIAQHDNEISLLVRQTDYIDDLNSTTDRIIQNESMINQTAQEISTKVSQDEYTVDMDGVSERISSAESSITQNANLIETKVSKDDYAVDKENLTSRVEENESIIAQQADQIQLRVTKDTYDTDMNSLTTRVESAEATLTVQADEIASKVSQEVYETDKEGTKTKISEMESTITQQAGQIASKVSQSTYNTDKSGILTRLDTAESTITQQAGQIASKVSQSTYNTDKNSMLNRIETAESTITQTANSIDSVVTQKVTEEVQTQAGTIKDEILGQVNSDYTEFRERLSTAESQISQQAGQIATKVTQTDVDNSINKLQIGGTNLWVESDVIAGYIATSGTMGTIVSSTACHRSMQTLVPVTAGETLTWQVWNPNNIINTSNANRWAWFDSTGTFLSNSASIPTLNNWTYKTGKITVPTNASYVRLGFIAGTANGTYDSSVKIKVERGNKPTDYSVAPEDIDTRISSAESNITQNANQIALKVNQSTYDTDKSGILTRLGTAESNITQNASNIALKVSKTTYDTDKAGILTRLGTAESNITQNANQIALKVTQTQVDNTVNNAVTNAVNNIQIGGRNLIRKSNVAVNSSTGTFDESTNTWTLTATAGNTNTWGCGLKFTGTNIRVPYGKTYIMSYEILVPKQITWNIDINCYPVSGSAWAGNDNDLTSGRKTSSKTLPANQWVKCWSIFTNTHSENADKVDLYDASNFGVIMTNETENMTFKIRNIMGEIGNKPSEWTPAPEDVDTKISDLSTRVTTNTTKISENATAINLRATKTEMTNNIKTAVDNINVGGTNLLALTKTFDGVGGDSTTLDETEEVYKDFTVRYLNNSSLDTSTYSEFSQWYNCIYPELGQSYTFSFFAKGTGKIRVHFHGNSGYLGCASNVSSQGVTNTASDGLMDITLSSNWKRYWVTWKLATSGDTTIAKHVLLRLFGGNTAYVCGAKLEIGNKATDWSENPNVLVDLEARLQNAEIQIESDAIISTVLESESYATLMDEYAKQSDIEDMATLSDIQDGLDGLDITGQIDERLNEKIEDESSKLNEKYVSYSQMTQTKNDIEMNFTQAGGINLIKNSLGYAGVKDGNWVVGHPNLLVIGDGSWKDVTLGQYWVALSGRIHYSDLGLKVGDWITYQVMLNAKSGTKSLQARITAYTDSTGNTYTTTVASSKISAGGNGNSALVYQVTDTNPYLQFGIQNGDSSTVTANSTEQYRNFCVEFGKTANAPYSTDPNEKYITCGEDPDSEQLGLNSSIMIAGNPYWTRLRQPFPTIVGETYTVSFYYKLTSQYINFEIWDYYLDEKLYNQQVSTATDGYQYVTLSFVATTDISNLRFTCPGNTEVAITGIMANRGSVAYGHTFAKGENYNSTIHFDMNGIKVSQKKNGRDIGYTKITSDSFSGYYDTDGDGTYEEIFTLREDAVVTKRTVAKNEIILGSLKAVNLDTSQYKGWAFVPTTANDWTLVEGGDETATD